MSDYFPSVVVSEVVGIEKPDIRIMEIALRKLGVRVDVGLYLGDHPLDVLCVKGAGMNCAWLFEDWDGPPDIIPYQVDCRIKHVTELPRIVE